MKYIYTIDLLSNIRQQSVHYCYKYTNKTIDACGPTSVSNNNEHLGLGPRPIPTKPGPASPGRRRVPPVHTTALFYVSSRPPFAAGENASGSGGHCAHHTRAPAKASRDGNGVHWCRDGRVCLEKQTSLDLRWNVGLSITVRTALHAYAYRGHWPTRKLLDIHCLYIYYSYYICIVRIMTELALTWKLQIYICEPSVGQHKSYISSYICQQLKQASNVWQKLVDR